jgi:phosphoglucosamine mutase
MSIFGTDGVRGRVNEYPMTPEIAMKIASIIGSKTVKSFNGGLKRVIIGKDTRKSCYMLESAITAGLISAGADVILTGPLPTPAVSMLTTSLRANYGIMISASHNLFEDNGIKIFDHNGVKISDDEQHEIERSLQLPYEKFYTEASAVGKVRRLDDVIGRYVEFVKSSISKSVRFSGIKIVLDVANGAAYKIAPEIFEELGAEVCVLNDTPNGENINKNCGSTYPDVISQKVKELGYDIGIAVDGDADRVIICDENGEIIDGDFIIGAIAKFMLEEKRLAGEKIVLTVMSNLGLEHFLKGLGVEVFRTPVGDRHVIAKMQEIGANLGGEQSGHIVLNDYSKTGDGILSALQILAFLIKNNLKASDIFKMFKKIPQSLVNISFPHGYKINLNDEALNQLILETEAEMGDEGRILVRKSGTENLVRIMVEGINKAKNKDALRKLTSYFEAKK